MSKTTLQIASVAAVLLLTLGSSCNSEDAARLLEGHTDDVAVVSKDLEGLLKDLPRAPAAAEASRADGRIVQIVSQSHVPPEISDAFEALTWDATCTVAFGQVPHDAGSLEQWLVNSAARYGIEFLPGGAQAQAEAVLSSLEDPNAVSDAEELCSGVGTVVRLAG